MQPFGIFLQGCRPARIVEGIAHYKLYPIPYPSLQSRYIVRGLQIGYTPA